MATITDNDKRINKVRRLLECRTDSQLADKLNAKQPQISRWRSQGFHKSTAALIDILLTIISRYKRENNRLNKELKALGASSEEDGLER